jgi:type I restriction enzyme R subunit
LKKKPYWGNHFWLRDYVDTTGIDEENTIIRDIIPNYTSMQSYRDRVESFVRKNNYHLVIHKLQSNEAITV